MLRFADSPADRVNGVFGCEPVLIASLERIRYSVYEFLLHALPNCMVLSNQRKVIG
jgi:hypothetical protein